MPEQPFDDIPPWPPTRWTEPLSPDFPSAFDRVAQVMQIAWVQAFGYELEPWQVQLLRAMLEVFPEGHKRAGQLRWMQAVASVGRQNGKSEIAAALSLWQLMVNPRAALVAGIATSVRQAGIVYQRARTIVMRTSLARSFKATGTRGISSRSPGASYTVEPSKSASLQGIPITLGIVDELHLLKIAMWIDMVNGAGGRPDCLVGGITTAGDDNSELLIHLYGQGKTSIDTGGANRVGFWVWEAPDSVIPDDDVELGRRLAMANPGVASGRRDLENLVTKVRTLPEAEVIRYDLNRFVASESVFIPTGTWSGSVVADEWPVGVRPIFTITRTLDWKWASITATGRRPDGSTFSDLVASVPLDEGSAIETLVDICIRLARHNPVTFGMAWETLADLGKALTARGLPVRMVRSGDMKGGAALFYTRLVKGLVKHPGHLLLTVQVPRAMRKNVGDEFLVVGAARRVKKSKDDKPPKWDIDAVLGTVEGVYIAETHIDRAPQLHF